MIDSKLFVDHLFDAIIAAHAQIQIRRLGVHNTVDEMDAITRTWLYTRQLFGGRRRMLLCVAVPGVVNSHQQWKCMWEEFLCQRLCRPRRRFSSGVNLSLLHERTD